MSIFNFDDFLGTHFGFLWMRMGRENKLPSLTMSKPGLHSRLKSKVIIKVDGEQLDLISCNQLMECLEDTLDT